MSWGGRKTLTSGSLHRHLPACVSSLVAGYLQKFRLLLEPHAEVMGQKQAHALSIMPSSSEDTANLYITHEQMSHPGGSIDIDDEEIIVAWFALSSEGQNSCRLALVSKFYRKF